MKFAAILALLTAQVLASTARADDATLKQTFADAFLVGAALSEDQVTGKAPAALELSARQFNTITPENILKWESIHPEPGKYNFEPADKFVEWGEKNGMFIVGHTLVWHSQTPAWVFEDADGKPLDREALLERMREHIHTVVGRYKGRIHAWDVVNEAIVTEQGDDAKGAWRETKWREIIGPDYIEKAFQFAHEADPNAKLYYNDYDEWKLGKRPFFAEIVKNVRAQGLPIDGIGLQGHWGFGYPQIAELESMFHDLRELDVPLMITELDINVLPDPKPNTGADVNVRFQDSPEFNPYPDGLPPELEQKLADRYAALFRVFWDNRDVLDRVTFWGVDDGQSWRNYWPIRGRTNYPLLFNRQYQPKPAFDAVVKVAAEGKQEP